MKKLICPHCGAERWVNFEDIHVPYVGCQFACWYCGQYYEWLQLTDEICKLPS
jgi:hypothetical protein